MIFILKTQKFIMMLLIFLKTFLIFLFLLDGNANINGVDLNSQFPANWELGKEIKSNLGFNKPAPRDFAGITPLPSEPRIQSFI